MQRTTQQIITETVKLIDDTIAKRPAEMQETARDELFQLSETKLLMEIARLAECIDRLRSEKERGNYIIRVLHDFPAISRLSELQRMIRDNHL